MKDIIKKFRISCVEYIKNNINSPDREKFFKECQCGYNFYKSLIDNYECYDKLINMKLELDEKDVSVILTFPDYFDDKAKIQVYFGFMNVDIKCMYEEFVVIEGYMRSQK